MSDVNYLKCACDKCGNHIEFPEEANGRVVNCPHCGQATLLTVRETPKGAGRKTGLVVPVGIGCVVLAGMGAGVFFWLKAHRSGQETSPAPKVATASATSTTNVAPEETPAPTVKVATKTGKSIEDFKVSAIQFEKTKGTSLVYAVGTVTNDSEFERFGVRIELNVFDQQGAKLTTAKEYIQMMEPHHEAKFRALVPDAKAASAAIASIKEDD
jgi:DNA-directed RNA polymerase subunit RPC12/RpoP